MRRTRPKGFIATALVVAVMTTLFVLAIVGYAKSGKTHIDERNAPVTEGVNVDLDTLSIDPVAHLVTVRATLFPQGSYLDAHENEFAIGLRVTSRTLKESTTFDIDPGQAVGNSFQFDLPVQGDPEHYPLDTFEYAYPDPDHPGQQTAAPLIKIEKLLDDGRTEPAAVGPASDDPGGLIGWTERWRVTGDGSTLYAQIIIERSGAIVGAVGVIVLLVLAMAMLAATIAWSVATARRPVEATMAGWFAAMLFALIPLANSMPGAPPVGAWIDVFVFLWAEIVLLASMGVFILSWFRFREPPDYSNLHDSRENRV
jgi:hypothetical protein